MDLANKEAGLVVGTGDLSELALGFATFAGDHIAMYDVNAERAEDAGAAPRRVGGRAPRERLGAARCCAPCSRRPSPRSSCRRARTASSCRRPRSWWDPTSSYDFFLHALLRLGAGPRKILFLAEHAFAGRYDEATLRQWLRVVPRAASSASSSSAR